MSRATEPAVPRTPESFIGAARRRQLVESAIAVIADVGLERASTVQIAMRAGVSRGVLTHHFLDRDDLIEAVVAEVYRVATEVLAPQVHAAPTPRDALLTFVGGSVDFYAAFPDHMAALGEIVLAERRSATKGRAGDPRHVQEMSDVATILRAGQAVGQFRDFDVEIVAGVIRSSLDAGLHRMRQDGEVEPLRSELVRIVDVATRVEA